ncbi:MAG TPA: hypothetical protein VMZ03_10760 [Chitinophagaceae bacterium]|nr:hypothetical protein [Chitinophagaceae bacterium]
MKKPLLVILVTVSFLACKKKKDIPDVSAIKVDLVVERFDRNFFLIDTTIPLIPQLQRLRQQHPDFYNDFMQEILGVNGSPDDVNTVMVTRQFLSGYSSIYDSLKPTFNNLASLRKGLTNAFQFVKYYFPNYKNGKVILFVGPFDAPGVASTASGLAIGLQQFAGKNFFVYQTIQAQELFPLYISRRFSPEYIVPNCMKAVALELFPDQSSGKPLIEQMIEKGKQWWLLDKFLPLTADSLKTGFTQQQLDWCNENEGQIWSDLIKNEDLNSLSPTVIQTYIGEGPFTQGFSQEYSPGNLGQWIGWQIIQKFAGKNPDMKPAEIMQTPARKILEEAKYKPK